MKMIRLMRLKIERLKELQHIDSLRQELSKQQSDKEVEIADSNRTYRGARSQDHRDQREDQKTRSEAEQSKKQMSSMPSPTK